MEYREVTSGMPVMFLPEVHTGPTERLRLT